MRIVYRLRSDWAATKIDYRRAPPIELCVDAFLGDRFALERDGTRVGFDEREGVPVFAWLLSVARTAREATDGSTATLCALYSSDEIVFAFKGDEVLVSREDEGIGMVAPITELREAANAALTDFVARAVGDHPEIRENPFFQRQLLEFGITQPRQGS